MILPDFSKAVCASAIAVFMVAMSGCVSVRSLNQESSRTVYLQEEAGHPSLASEFGSNNHLPEISVDSRRPIRISGIEQFGGTLVLEQSPFVLRNLTIKNCARLAGEISPVANALDAESQRVIENQEQSEWFSQILSLQAVHERNDSVGQACEAYLNLLEVYLQYDILAMSQAEIAETRSFVTKLNENSIATGIDQRELDREEFSLAEKAAELNHLQKRISTNLELLIGLEREPAKPIWTDFQSKGITMIVELESSLGTALENRSDVKALERVVNCSNEEIIALVKSGAGQIHPLLGMSFGENLFPISRRRKKAKAEEMAQSRRQQISDLIEARKKLIVAEVADLVFSIQKRQKLILLKQSKIQSLQLSISETEKAAEVRSINIPQLIANKSRILKEQSTLISEIVRLEIDFIKLRTAQGLN